MLDFPIQQKLISAVDTFTAVDNLQVFSGVRLARWQVEDCNQVKFLSESDHTLSFYLEGGYKTYRNDQKSHKGSPGKFCLMPQGQESIWQVKDKLKLAHLYFSDKQLKYFAATHLEIDARQVQLQDLVYQADKKLEGLFKKYTNSLLTEPVADYLFSEQILTDIFAHLIIRYASGKPDSIRLKGGLSAFQRKKIQTYIDENLQEKLTIEALARIINMSPFHFAHLFKQSFAESPANFVLKRRIEKAKILLVTLESINAIALLTGFSQQSHFTLYFRRHVGVTPAEFRRLIKR